MLIDVFYDTVEILSPRWFISGQDPKEHLAGRSKSPKTRNPLIVQTLYRLKDIAHYATGLPGIKELCDAVGIRVQYRHVPDGTHLVFHHRVPFEGVGGEGVSNRSMVSDGEVRETINSVSETINPLDGAGDETITMGDDLWDVVATDTMALSPEGVAVSEAVALRPSVAYASAKEVRNLEAVDTRPVVGWYA